MKQYTKYKHSGVQWLGNIPEHWEVDKIKHVFTERSEKGFPTEPILCSTQKYGVIPQSMYENRVVSVNKGFDSLKLVEKGDFVISLRSFQGGIEYAHYRGIISAAYTILKLKKGIEADYLKYLLKSVSFVQLLQSTVTGIREGQNINYNQLKYDYLPLPPLSEQRSIASYLDEQVSRIDRAIAQQQQMIALLGERKQIVINHAVTRGLNENVKLKDSGVQWIGEIPEKWEVRKIKYSGQFAKGKLPNKTNEEKLGLPVIGASEMLGKDIRTFTEDFSVPQCTENDILILWDGANAGITASGLSGVVSSTAMKYTITDDKYLPDFVKYFFKALEKHFKSKVGGTTIPHMNMAFINEVPFLCPSKSEQRSIASYLDEQVSRIDRAIAQQQQMIALLGERKQIVINHAVTRGLNENDIQSVEHLKLRYVFEFRNGYTPSKANQEFWENGTIPWFRMEDIRKNGRILSDSIQHITSKAIKGKGLFKANSYILATTATIGEHARLIADSLANQRFTNLKIRKSLEDKIDLRFMDYYMYVIGDWCKTSVNTTCFSSVDINELKQQTFPLALKETQRSIASYLDEQCGAIDTAIGQLQRQIALLQERKQILINEVVTGKVKVI